MFLQAALVFNVASDTNVVSASKMSTIPLAVCVILDDLMADPHSLYSPDFSIDCLTCHTGASERPGMYIWSLQTDVSTEQQLPCFNIVGQISRQDHFLSSAGNLVMYQAPAEIPLTRSSCLFSLQSGATFYRCTTCVARLRLFASLCHC